MIAYADNVTLADVRTSVITSGVIPDTYLIEPTGTYWDSHNATIAYNFLKSWIESKDESVPSSLFQNKVNRALFNTAILLEGRADSIHQITALVTAKERALGTYNESGYLKKYHDYIISNHNIPNTANGIDTALSQALGNMAPLAGEITSVANRAASIAGIPNGLLESDFEYWIDVEITTYCKLDNGANHADCAPGAGNQTDIVSGEAHTVPASWYWRAYSCLSSFRGESYGAVCSGIKTGSSSSNFHIDIGTTTVAGQGIVSKLTVKNAPAGTSATTQITVNAGARENHPKSITTGTGGKFDVIGTWKAYTDATHPCYTSDGYPDVWCIPAVTWTFSGKSTINIGGHGGSIVINPPGDTTQPVYTSPEITSTDPPKFGYVGHLYNYDVDGNKDGLKYSIHEFVRYKDSKDIRSLVTIDTSDGNLTWNIPNDITHLGKYNVTVKVEDKKESDTQSFNLTVRQNIIPTLEVWQVDGDKKKLDISAEPGDDCTAWFGSDQFNREECYGNNRVIWRFAGNLFDEVRYDFRGVDNDDIHTDQRFILSVSNQPSVLGGALTDCEPDIKKLTIYQNGSVISNTTKSPITGSACILALDTVNLNPLRDYADIRDGKRNEIEYDASSDRFEVQLSDGVDVVTKDMWFVIINQILEATEWGKFGAEIGTSIIDAFARGVGKAIKPYVEIQYDISADVVNDVADAYALMLRCEINYLQPKQSCDNLPPLVTGLLDLLKSIDALGTDASGQSETQKPRWTLVANVSNTRNIAINDTNIEPNMVYTYVTRIIVGDKASDYIPLGNVTTPVDGPPVLILNQPNMTVLLGSPYVDPGYVAVDYYEGNVTDRVWTWAITPVDTSKETSYRIFYYVDDSVGNQAPTQVRTVDVVAQDLPPTITLIDGAEITVPASVPYVEPGYAAIDAIDGNVTDSVTVTGLVNTDVPGTYMLQYSASDSAGNIATQNRTVIVADMTPPTLTLIGGARVPTALSVPYVDPGYEAIDNIDGNVTGSVVVTGTVDTSTEGAYILQYDVSDSSGNAAMTQNRTVIVTSDMTPPVITLKGHLRIEVAAGIPYVDPGYTAIDDVDGNITERVVVTGLVNTDVLHAYMLHYDVSDSSGNAAITQSRVVSVVDATPPVFTLKGGASITVPASVPYVDPGYTAIDAIYGNVTHRVAVSGTVNTDVLGSYTLLYFADDASGNLADVVRRTVTVADLTPPVITLKGDSELQITKGTTYVEPGYTAIDNIDGNVTGSVTVTGTVDANTPGMYTISYGVNDRAGNAAITQNRTITVMGDDTPPTITLKGQQAITIEGHAEYVEPGYTATDDIDGNITDSVVVTGTVNTVVLDTYTLNYDVSDSSGNAAITQNRTITVVDTTPPVITLKGDSELQITKGTTYVEPGYTATDNIDGNITSSVVVTGTVDTSMAGTYTISYDVTDGAGNAAITQNRTITVMGDDTPPTITLKGQQAITIEGHTEYVEPGYTATDDIDGNITDMVIVTGTVNTVVLDTYTLNYDVSDSSGNAAITQNRTITVVDTTPPVITLKGGSELQITKGTTYVEPGYAAIDNIDGNITGLVVVTGSVDASTLGMYTISYEVTDGAGNVATKVLTVTVVLDTVTPIITLSDGSSITLPMGPTFTEPGYTAIDNIDGNITSMVDVTGTVNPLIPGTYTVSYAVTDSSGNTGQQTRTVTISPPTDTTQYCNNVTLAQLMTSGKYNIINKMFSSKSNIKGTDGADLIIVGNNGPTIEGRDGDDCIIGGTGNDTILGQSGNDMIFGNDGDDTIRGGPGHDHLWGQNGNDIMHGGENGDTMYGGADADIMYGGPGQDTIRGGSGNDQIWGLGGNDTIYGDAGDDMLYAGPGIDTIYGGPGTDTIESGESDTVHDDE